MKYLIHNILTGGYWEGDTHRFGHITNATLYSEQEVHEKIKEIIANIGEKVILTTEPVYKN